MFQRNAYNSVSVEENNLVENGSTAPMWYLHIWTNVMSDLGGRCLIFNKFGRIRNDFLGSIISGVRMFGAVR